jgi:hypothetical protein
MLIHHYALDLVNISGEIQKKQFCICAFLPLSSDVFFNTKYSIPSCVCVYVCSVIYASIQSTIFYSKSSYLHLSNTNKEMICIVSKIFINVAI